MSLASISDFYRTDTGFKEYVDRYSAKHRMLPEDTFSHAIIKEAYKEYRFGVNKKTT